MQTNPTRRIPLPLLVLAVLLLVTVNPASAEQEASQVPTVKTVVAGLDAPTDFSVTQDGEVVFIAEQGSGLVRRVEVGSNEIVVSEIKTVDQSAQSISVHAINANRVLVGVSGFSSAKQSLCLFDVSAKKLPLDFNDNRMKHSKSFERSLKRNKGLSVLQLFGEQRGLTMVCRLGEASLTLCDVHFKDGNVDRLVEHDFEAGIANVSTFTVDQMGGYFASHTQNKPSQIVFYRADGKLMQAFPIDLENIVSMSFSPSHNRLFAVVGNTNGNASDDRDGIYEILTDGDACKGRFVIGIDSPKKLKFDPQGNAWVLCIPSADASMGALKKVTGLDVRPAILALGEGGADAN